MELFEAIWDIVKFILLVGGGAYGISYWIDITGDAKTYKKANQELRNKIEKLESTLDRYRDSHNEKNNENPNLEYNSPTDLKKYALIYHEKFDFNISCISSEINQYNRNDNVLKAPNHEWVELQKNRQTKSEINNYDWHKATGLGIILGYNNIRAFDIDCCVDFSLVDIFLKELELPDDYEWVIKSGSEKGFHILFYCDDYEQAHDGYGRVSYMSKKNLNFQKIDLMWDGHLVLPPTIHKDNNNYTFMFVDTRIAFFEDKIPKYRPKIVDKKNVDNLLGIITDFKRTYPSY